MVVETTDKNKPKEIKKKSTREGIPMSEKALADYNKVWKDMDSTIDFCKNHPCKLTKK